VITANLKLIVMKIIEFNDKPNRNFHDIPKLQKLGFTPWRKSHQAKSWDLRHGVNPTRRKVGIYAMA